MDIVAETDIPKLEQILDVPLDKPLEVYKVCQELEEVCIRESGIGLSAVQVGIPWKLFIVKGDGSCPYIKKDQFAYFANCRYDSASDKKVVTLEGCLSLRSNGRLRTFYVERYVDVLINGYRLSSLEKFEEIKWLINISEEGGVFQHEIDHHFSVLISEIGKECFILQ